MNIFYTMPNGLEGLNKFASGYLNDADTLTGLFYGMLKEAARTNRNGRGRVGRTNSTHTSFDTPEAQAKAESSSAAATAKAATKKQRNIENSFHFPKNDTSPAHLKEQARIKQTFRFADPEYSTKLRDRLARIQGALLGKRNEEIASLQGRYNAQADELSGVRDALKSAKAQREIDRALISTNGRDLERVRNLANSRKGQIKNLTRSLKRTKLGMIGAGLGSLGLGAGATALYNNRQAQ